MSLRNEPANHGIGDQTGLRASSIGSASRHLDRDEGLGSSPRASALLLPARSPQATSMSPLRIVILGCGGRGRTYAGLAGQQPHRYRVVAGADPHADRVELVRRLGGDDPDFRSFSHTAACLAAGKLGDLVVVSTQDHDHIEPTLRAMELGYDVLLEKPIATDPASVLRLSEAATRLGRKVLVCHVLRYSALWSNIHRIVNSGRLGKIIDIGHREGVGAWHQVHSFVRRDRSNPMILAKSCHDTDLMSWLAGSPCTRISSFGRLSHFHAANAPAGSTERCTDNCPHAGRCPYDAQHYANRHRTWLAAVEPDLAERGDAQQIRRWLEHSPWGRCAWRCDNDAVDHQVLAMEFANGITATMTMTAFDEGRQITICGTEGRLYAGEALRRQSNCDIVIEGHHGGREVIDVVSDQGGYDSHGGGDAGLIQALADELAKPDPDSMRTSLTASVESHFMAFAAEESRLHGGQVVDLSAFRTRVGSGAA